MVTVELYIARDSWGYMLSSDKPVKDEPIQVKITTETL